MKEWNEKKNESKLVKEKGYFSEMSQNVRTANAHFANETHNAQKNAFF